MSRQTASNTIPVSASRRYTLHNVYTGFTVVLFVLASICFALTHNVPTRAACMLFLCFPVVLAYVESTIKKVATKKARGELNLSEPRRQVLFIVITSLPVMNGFGLPEIPAMLQECGLRSSETSSVVIVTSAMLILIGGGIVANRRWALDKLQLEQ